MEHQDLLLFTCPFPEPDESSSRPSNLFHEDKF